MVIPSALRRAAACHARWAAGVACLLLFASCGGGSSVTVGSPPPSQGPVVNGIVSMPNGQVAARPSLLERFAQVVVARVEALVAGTVHPVGAGVAVQLVQINDTNIVDGQIQNGKIVFNAVTDGNGGYAVRLPGGTTVDTCRFYLAVGSEGAGTLTRAFVISDRVNIDVQSETTVRLLLEQIGAGKASLCGLKTSDIAQVYNAVVASTANVGGGNTATVNDAAFAAASADPGVQNAIALITNVPTPGPTTTNTAAPAATATATMTAAATNTRSEPTSTRPPLPTSTNTVTLPTHTSTPGASPTNTVHAPTATAVATNTSRPTSTSTAVPSHTAVPTNTAPPPTATATGTAVPSNTAVPTNTAVPPTSTSVPTNTAPPSTNTPLPTSTPAATGTATVAAMPRIALGLVAGTAGGTVTVPIVLTAGGVDVAAVSNDIEYDSSQVDVATVGGSPDCTADARLAAAKQVHARVTALTGTQKRLRVGLIGAANNDVITSGLLYICRFTIGADASGSADLINTPAAASPQAVAVAVGGGNGRIDVTAAPPALTLGNATAAAGGSAMVSAVLSAHGTAVAAVATDIEYDTTLLSVGDNDGEPDCTIDPAISAVGKELLAKVLPAVDNKARLRVGVIGPDNNTALPNPDGTVTLFQCRFVVQPAASGAIALEHSPAGAGPDALPVGLNGEPGSITVQ